MNNGHDHDHHHVLCRLVKTARFSVLEEEEEEKNNSQQQQQHHKQQPEQQQQTHVMSTHSLNLFFQNEDAVPIFKLADLLREQLAAFSSSSKSSKLDDASSSSSLSSSSSSLSSTRSSFGQRLWQSLARHGFVLLTCPVTSRPAQILQRLQKSLIHDIFPIARRASSNDETSSRDDIDNNMDNNHHSKTGRLLFQKKNAAALTTSHRTYVSERGIPMYKLGYELTEDGVREIFRIAAGCPDDNVDDAHSNTAELRSLLLFAEQPRHVRSTWLQALGLMRHVTDAALDILLLQLQQQQSQQEGKQQKQQQQQSLSSWPCRNTRRPFSGGSSWNHTHHHHHHHRQGTKRTLPSNGSHDDDNGNDDDCYYYHQGRRLDERKGDFSVLYAMHYFNDNNHSHLTNVDAEDPVKQQQQHRLLNECSGSTIWNRNDTTQEELHASSTCPCDDDKKSPSSSTFSSSSSSQQRQEQQESGNGIPLAVKAHVDPSLLVIEPFLTCPDYYYDDDDDADDVGDARKNNNDNNNRNRNKDVVVAGLQIWHEPTSQWWHVDGPDSIVPPLLRRHFQQQQQQQHQQQQKQHVMLVFCGKGLVEATATVASQVLAAATGAIREATTNGGTAIVSSQQQQQAYQLPPLQATLHRVVQGDCPRRTVIYEQKYEEFYPTPDFD